MTDTLAGAILAPSGTAKSPSLWRRLRADRARLAVAAIIAALALLPVAGLVVFAFAGGGDTPWSLLLTNVLPRAGVTTLMLLLGVGLVATITGGGLAFLVARCRFPGRRIAEWALLLPLAMPTYVMAYAWLDVLHPVGPLPRALRAMLGIADPRGLWLPELRSLPGAIFVIGFVLYPYVYLPVRALLLMRAAALGDAARMLGAGWLRRFRDIDLPMVRPAIGLGLSLVLLETLNDIGASEFLGIRTLTVTVYTTWAVRSSIEGAAQIALVMLAVVLVLIWIERFARRHLEMRPGARSTRPPKERTLGRMAGMLALFAALLPILLGFAVPAAYLASAAFERLSEKGPPDGLVSAAANSLGFALVTTMVAVSASLALAFAVRGERSGAVRRLALIAALGYAIPGTVLAVGLLMPVAALDNRIADLVVALTGRSPGLVLIGSGAALLLALSLRFLAVASGPVENGLARISLGIDGAASSLGAGRLRILAGLHMPLLAPGLASAAILVFVDTMKELPATLLLRPLNVETLATTLYGEAARGTHEDGAIAALLIVLVGLLPVIRLSAIGRTPARAERRDAA